MRMLLALPLLYAVLWAQTPRPLITSPIDETKLSSLAGNVRPEARVPANDKGKVADTLPMSMVIVLARAPEQAQALAADVDTRYNRQNPNFHKWLTSGQFNAQWATNASDRQTIAGWLQSHAFTVKSSSNLAIEFWGTAAQVTSAFHTEIHNLTVNKPARTIVGTANAANSAATIEKHVGNVSAPQIPTALAPAIAGIIGLSDFHPKPQYTYPNPNNASGTFHSLVPYDLEKIYNIFPAWSAGFTGTGQIIALAEDADMDSTADWTSFRSVFGLSGYTSGSMTTIHPQASGHTTCTDPGFVLEDSFESTLDVEWATAAAPNATLWLASCADGASTGPDFGDGVLIALENLVNLATPPNIISISYGECEANNGPAPNLAYYDYYQQAAEEGISVFVASDDQGASLCSVVYNYGAIDAETGISANALATPPYVTSVGGTDFGEVYANGNSQNYPSSVSAYWSATNNSVYGSVESYLPEIPWNDTCAGILINLYEGFGSNNPVNADSMCNTSPPLGTYTVTTPQLQIANLLQLEAAGGGPSNCGTGTSDPDTLGGNVANGTCAGWPKPSWQSVLGNPSDGVRDTPDVALYSAAGLWAHLYLACYSGQTNNPIGPFCANASGPSGPCVCAQGAGTSFATPIMAGVMALINQKTGNPQGLAAPKLYELARAEYGSGGSSACNSTLGSEVSSSCVFYDITEGDIAEPCSEPGAAPYNCYGVLQPQEGILSTSNSVQQNAYPATSGWDFATGLGSVNVYNLVQAWAGLSNPNKVMGGSAVFGGAGVQ